MECERLVAAFRSEEKNCCPGQRQIQNAKLRPVAAFQTVRLMYAQASVKLLPACEPTDV